MTTLSLPLHFAGLSTIVTGKACGKNHFSMETVNMLARSHSRIVLIWMGLAMASAGVARADDWPQWLGPQRDGVWREKGIVDKFPAGGPKARWRTPIGAGYAGPAVVNGRVYVTDRLSD